MKQPKRFPVSVHPPIIIYEANGYGNNQREIEKNKKKCSILSCFCILTYYKMLILQRSIFRFRLTDLAESGSEAREHQKTEVSI